ncbi:type VII secretion AAA-ATPase EccA, partial [Mycobacterium kansasii]
QGEDEDAAEVLQDLFAAHPENKQVEEALLDSTFGLLITNAARIDARTDPWDPETEPSESDFVDPGAKERKAHLLVEA